MDLVEVRHVATSIARFGDRYLGRVFTAHEIASCVGPPSAVAAGLAARFAAKEATIKVLRPTAHQPDWQSMEVRRNPDGWCSMVLSGHAVTLADEAGIDEMAVSLTHEESIAGAVVVAMCQGSSRAVQRSGAQLGSVKERNTLMDEEIRQILAEHARILEDVSTIGDDDDLFQLGMTSHASVNVMLALEDSFDFEFPERMLRKSTFESIAAIRSALTELTNA
jgi:holo-[acyl-carrier-protein] synthase